ncbi:hypothetical protein tinsulaeT_20800 [Thalassotalea insulae]|uniref:Fibronectin type-III domain-containing protein n=1 Tax=Thalassotalea insulae TaxID=2056778 RepID=A0ABQ6GVL8_9GAMM|nr:fibronectin type III domain-containing protein [Thalassotalea insulae]GLX78740.1 hypothetical protein tinsulaeT_20800 [Thalassotalea insulae]
MQGLKNSIVSLLLATSVNSQTIADEVDLSWLPVVVYDFLDDSPTVPVMPADTRSQWDAYSVELITESGANQLVWQAQTNIDHYQIEYRIGDGEWITQTTTTNNLQLDVALTGTVEFRIIGCQSETLCSSYSNELNTYISAEPGNLPSYIFVPKYVKYNEPFAIEWSQLSNASAYELQQQANGQTFTTIYTGTPELTNNRHEVRLAPLTKGDYCYRLRAKVATDYGDYSTPVCTYVGERTLASVSSFEATETEPGKYHLAWQHTPYATTYQLERETLTVSENVQNVQQSSKLNTSYKVQASNSESSTELKWQSVASGSLTELEQIHTIDTFDRDGLQKYRIKACDNIGSCGAATELSYTVPVTHIVDGVPKNVKPSGVNNNIVKLDWNPVPGANSYVVEMSRKGSTWVRLITGLLSPTMTRTITLAGEYKFKVNACINTGFCGEYSPVAEFEATIDSVPNKTPQFFALSCKLEDETDPDSPCVNPPEGWVDVAWRAPVLTGVSQYEVMGELKNVIAKQVFNADADGYYHLKRAAGTEGREYCYVVRAWYSDGSKGDYTETKCIVIGDLAFEKPNNFLINQVASQEFKIKWDAVAGATKYLLEQQISVSEWQAIQYSEATSKQLQYGSAQQAVYNVLGHMGYRVSACRDDNVCGKFARVYLAPVSSSAFLTSPPLEHKVPACLRVPEVVAAGESIPVSWCPPQQSGVHSYDIVGELKSIIVDEEQSFFAKDKQGLLTINRPSLPEGREYCYKVRAKYSDGSVSDYTEKQCTTVGSIVFDAPAEMLYRASTTQFNNFDIAWSPITNADHYLLERQSEVGLWQTVNCQASNISINTNDYVGCNLNLTSDDLLQELGQVFYRVSACNAENVCGNYQRVNFELMSTLAEVYQTADGSKLYLQLSDGQYIELERDESNRWTVNLLSQAQWDAISPTTNFTVSGYSIESGDYSADGLADFKLINGSEEIIFLHNESEGYSQSLGRTVLFIHTDLLGTPVAETGINGNIN